MRLPRPPELNPAEPGGLSGAGALEHRQFGEENRAVHIEPKPVRPHRGNYLAFHRKPARPEGTSGALGRALHP